MSGRSHGSFGFLDFEFMDCQLGLYEHFECVDSPQRSQRFGSYGRFGAYYHLEFIDSPQRRNRFGSYYRCPCARSAIWTVFLSGSKRNVFFVSTSPPVTLMKKVSSPYSIE